MHRSKLPDYSITSSARAGPDWSRSRRFSVQPILAHRVTRLVHRLQLLAAQEGHLGRRPAAHGDPPLDRRRMIECSIMIASRLVKVRPLPKSYAAWKPSAAQEVTQILS
jgi:hypothetical protein